MYIEPIIFEEYGAEDASMEEANEKDVTDCDIFVGIYGLGYSSPTEREFK